jgi:putative ABC transport system permease protein
VVRTRGDPIALAEPARRLLASLDPSAPMMQVRTMPAFVETSPSVFTRRYPMLLIGAFAAVALLLAVIGIYGVMSFSVAQRTRELGIRIALGATRREIAGIVVRDAAVLALMGAAIGIPLALALTRLLASLLYGVTARDPLTYASVAALLCAVAMAAAWLPARRATRVDPTEALRAD